MRPYLARLAARAVESQELAPAPARPVADPFQETADPAIIPVISGDPSSHSTAPRATAPPVAIAAVPPESAPALAPSDEAASFTAASAPLPAAPNESDHATIEPITLPADPGLSGRTSEMMNGHSEEQSGISGSRESPTVILPNVTEKDSESAVKEPAGADASAGSNEGELLRLADLFMAGVRQNTAGPTAKPQAREEPPPLSPRETVAQHARQLPADPAPAPSVHIGSLRVEVVASPAPPSRIAAPPQGSPRRVVMRPAGQGSPARSIFGLRQI